MMEQDERFSRNSLMAAQYHMFMTREKIAWFIKSRMEIRFDIIMMNYTEM